MAKVLLVEDDNNLREIYEARLVAEGYDIASARDGEEALVVAKEEMPDLVISDVMMPKISGFEMLDILRNTEGLQHVKVIMLTALGQSEDQSRADSLGANRYLVKSQVTLEDIVNAAHDLLVEAGAINAPAAVQEPAPVAAIPEPIIAPVAVAAAPQPVVAPSVIPMASAPPQLPEEMQATTTSMPPTPVSTVPFDDLITANHAPAPEPVIAVPAPMPEPIQVDQQTDVQQTSDQEESIVEQQIESFITSQNGQPEAEVQPIAVEPTPAPETAQSDSTTPEQEQALTDAVQNLGGAEDNIEPTPASEIAKGHGVSIEPISNTASNQQSSSNLEQLLAAEAAEEKLGADTPVATPTFQPAPQIITPVVESVPVPNAQQSAPSQRPQMQPQPTQTAQVQQTPPTTPPASPAPNGDFDPNSIAL